LKFFLLAKEGTNIRVFGDDSNNKNDNILLSDSQLVNDLVTFPAEKFETISRNFFICYASALGMKFCALFKSAVF